MLILNMKSRTEYLTCASLVHNPPCFYAAVFSIELLSAIMTDRFAECIDDLISHGQLLGVIQGGHSLDRAVYVPEIFSTAVNRWISDFYSQNGHIG